jgi:hypothetical protein
MPDESLQGIAAVYTAHSTYAPEDDELNTIRTHQEKGSDKHSARPEIERASSSSITSSLLLSLLTQRCSQFVRVCGRLTTNTTSRLHHLALAGRLGLASHFSYLVRPDQTIDNTSHLDRWMDVCMHMNSTSSIRRMHICLAFKVR